LCVVAIRALAAMVRLIGANGTMIRRAARILAIATAIGLDRVAVATAVARAVVPATVDVPVLRAARAIRMATRRQRPLAITA